MTDPSSDPFYALSHPPPLRPAAPPRRRAPAAEASAARGVSSSAPRAPAPRPQRAPASPAPRAQRAPAPRAPRAPAPAPAPSRASAASSRAPAPGPRPHRFPKYITDAAASLGVRYGELEVTEESQYSCLMPYQFGQVSEAYSAELGAFAPGAVVDATANVGCDTIQMRRMFPAAQITALEVDPATADLLAKNMAKLGRVLGGSPAPVHTANADCVAHLGVGAAGAVAAQADLVYFDVPWGGPEYYRAPALDLFLSGRPLGDVVGRTLLLVAPVVVVKLPVNANFGDFRARVCAAVPAAFSFRDILKPRGNKKGNVAYRLAFIRRAPVDEPDADAEPDEPAADGDAGEPGDADEPDEPATRAGSPGADAAPEGPGATET